MLAKTWPLTFAGRALSLASIFSGGRTGDFWIAHPDTNDATIVGDSITIATGQAQSRTLTNTGTAPTLQQVSGNYVIRFPGSGGSRLIHNFGSALSQPGVLILCVTNTDTATHVMATGSSSSLRWQISNDGSGNIIGFCGSTLDSTINEGFGTKVLTLRCNGASSVFRVNGVQTASGNAGSNNTDQITFGAVYDGTFGGAFDLYAGCLIDCPGTEAISDAELDFLERLAGSYAGLTW